MFLHGRISVRLMMASVVDMVRALMGRGRWRDDVRRRRRRVSKRKRMVLGRTRVGMRRRLILARRRGWMVRQLSGRR